ncbi:MBL fold metallo-hydrolase [Nostocoides sp. HKS02]|uniref:MBL fold metallo-hydrolase n=1 Tax=Nostocoides sp. HKS02 TaxID=1813880 RepID=UPI0012B45B77|nr:MBL fold metallo-hydrolase [Tetrasphaera sp. HKS02]QGN58451.1 MBL fold metallo-hydrolase [Tetrasphaera sp. HKS02]
MPDISPSPGGVRVERVVTTGSLTRAHGDLTLENNTWIIGDDDECVIVDAGHDGRAIVKAIARGRAVKAVLVTHGHFDHLDAVGEVCDGTRAPAYLHPADRFLWDEYYPVTPDGDLADGDTFTVGDVELTVLHTPGHTPGSCSFHAPALGAVFTGDTLFPGGPGATRHDYSDFTTIIDSVRTRLFTLPGDTVVLPGHGDTTVIAEEAPHLQEWVDRGW